MADSPIARKVHATGLPGHVIASLAGLAPWQLYGYANGRLRIPPSHLQRLAAALGCEPKELIGDD
jgi:hypothetical protein